MPVLTRRSRRLGLTAAAVAAALIAPRLVLAQSEVLGAEDLTSPPKLVSPAATARLVARSFTDEMRKAGTGGTVQLQFVIGTNGKVEPGSIEVIETPAPALGTAAKAVAEKMEFVPGKKNGAAVRARVQLPITYKP